MQSYEEPRRCSLPMQSHAFAACLCRAAPLAVPLRPAYAEISRPCLCSIPHSSAVRTWRCGLLMQSRAFAACLTYQSCGHGVAACSCKAAPLRHASLIRSEDMALRPAYAGPHLRSMPHASAVRTWLCGLLMQSRRILSRREGRVPPCVETENPPQLDSWLQSSSSALRMILPAVRHQVSFVE